MLGTSTQSEGDSACKFSVLSKKNLGSEIHTESGLTIGVVWYRMDPMNTISDEFREEIHEHARNLGVEARHEQHPRW